MSPNCDKANFYAVFEKDTKRFIRINKVYNIEEVTFGNGDFIYQQIKESELPEYKEPISAKKYQEIAETVEAIQFDGSQASADAIGRMIKPNKVAKVKPGLQHNPPTLTIGTNDNENSRIVNEGDYVVKTNHIIDVYTKSYFGENYKPIDDSGIEESELPKYKEPEEQKYPDGLYLGSFHDGRHLNKHILVAEDGDLYSLNNGLRYDIGENDTIVEICTKPVGKDEIGQLKKTIVKLTQELLEKNRRIDELGGGQSEF